MGTVLWCSRARRMKERPSNPAGFSPYHHLTRTRNKTLTERLSCWWLLSIVDSNRWVKKSKENSHNLTKISYKLGFLLVCKFQKLLFEILVIAHFSPRFIFYFKSCIKRVCEVLEVSFAVFYGCFLFCFPIVP